jgi:hypothetical protein
MFDILLFINKFCGKDNIQYVAFVKINEWFIRT